MTVRITKPKFNLREKIAELDKPTGLKGNELMRSETSQEAREFISAGRKNLIINGDMRINQRGTSSHTLNSGNPSAYIVDRFVVQCAEGTLVASQDTDVPSGQGFVKSIKLDCTGADTSLGSSFESFIQYLPEAQDLAHLAYGGSGAKTVTFSFWVKSNLTQTFGFYYYMPDASRAYQTTFNINSADTWEKKVITIVGDTTGNGFNNDNGVGAELRIYLAAGTGLDGTSAQNVWGTNTANRIPPGTNILSSTDNNFYFTGFQMEVGENATEFEHRSYTEELSLCQRYLFRLGGLSKQYQVVATGFIGHNGSTDTGKVVVHLPTTMRTNPSVSVIGTDAFWVHTGGAETGTTDMDATLAAGGPWASASSGNQVWLDFGRTGGGSPNRGVACVVYTKNNNQGELLFNAEL